MQMGKSLTATKFFEILSLSNRKYRIIVFSVVLFLLLIIPVSFLESMPNLSICSRVLGEYCYSVGITRGVSSLLKGNIADAIDYNILSVPVLFVMISILLYDFYQLSREPWARKFFKLR